MTLAFLALLLVSDYDLKWPDPYIGYGLAINKIREDQANQTQNAYRRKFINLGLPFRIIDPNQTNPFYPHYVLTPELGWYNDLIQVNLAGGYEGYWPMGYRARTSIIWSAQGGMHYSIIRTPNYANEYGKIMNSEEKTSFALLVNAYTGCRWDIMDKYAVKFLINPKMMLGKVAFNSLRTEFFKYMGLSLSFNVQLEFN
jgi:hypothetical protein